MMKQGKYEYEGPGELWNDLTIRLRIIEAAAAFNAKGHGFAGDDLANIKGSKHWERQDVALIIPMGDKKVLVPGIVWKRGPKSSLSEAVDELYSKKGSYDCASAISVIVLKAFTESYKSVRKEFLKEERMVVIAGGYTFPTDPSPSKDMITVKDKVLIPGDICYFFNPGSKRGVWLRENAIYLGDGRFFGHGIGIKSYQEMAGTLYGHSGSVWQFPYLLEQKGRPNPKPRF
jgi:hypothetical protein